MNLIMLFWTVFAQVVEVGTTAFDAGSMSASTYEFTIDGDYDEVVNITFTLNYSPTKKQISYAFEGGQEKYSLTYAPEDGITYDVSLMDKHNCPINEQTLSLRGENKRYLCFKWYKYTWTLA